ncbi:poly-gamma-glutamate synthesis protein (capsule biosynthesis protein) [Streptomyces sp. TverLS-915]|uniref:CapA family protein n=1 Tax=Streptomyces sp. TverLS-915 TaxID=1839763 RepID=UPI00081DB1E3|nr:CapA family protein [Streptomyces sp. TverLS-915]SCD48651.1 poly-gamma-glutamate synthesis protein (capsule biosynthesis protein) [Streptomyces sp. TverLS-915]
MPRPARPRPLRPRLAGLRTGLLLAGLASLATACAGLTGAEDAPAAHARPHGAGGAPASPPPASPSPSDNRHAFTLLASGDVLPHDSVIKQAHADAGGKGYDFRPMLSGVKPVVSRADLAICHMETVYGDDDGPYTGYPAFVSPPQVATALATTGYDSCSTASNHSLDDGTAGVSRTLGALDRAGIAHAGTGRSEAEAHRPAWLTAGGAKVAHLSYTYGTNDIPLPKDAPWTVRLIDEGRVVQDARAAREAGADVVVVSMHWGTEWQTAPDAQQRQLAQALTASRTGERPDIDLVIGTHAHVPQAYEKVNGTWVIYGMGDQIAGRMINYDDVHDPRGNEGTLGRFTFTPPAKPGARWEVTKAEFLPQWYDLAVNRVVDVDDAIAKGRDLTAVRDRLREVVLSRGAAKDGLVEGR